MWTTGEKKDKHPKRRQWKLQKSTQRLGGGAGEECKNRNKIFLLQKLLLLSANTPLSLLRIHEWVLGTANMFMGRCPKDCKKTTEARSQENETPSSVFEDLWAAYLPAEQHWRPLSWPVQTSRPPDPSWHNPPRSLKYSINPQTWRPSPVRVLRPKTSCSLQAPGPSRSSITGKRALASPLSSPPPGRQQSAFQSPRPLAHLVPSRRRGPGTWGASLSWAWRPYRGEADLAGRDPGPCLGPECRLREPRTSSARLCGHPAPESAALART